MRILTSLLVLAALLIVGYHWSSGIETKSTPLDDPLPNGSAALASAVTIERSPSLGVATSRRDSYSVAVDEGEELGGTKPYGLHKPGFGYEQPTPEAISELLAFGESDPEALMVLAYLVSRCGVSADGVSQAIDQAREIIDTPETWPEHRSQSESFVEYCRAVIEWPVHEQIQALKLIERAADAGYGPAQWDMSQLPNSELDQASRATLMELAVSSRSPTVYWAVGGALRYLPQFAEHGELVMAAWALLGCSYGMDCSVQSQAFQAFCFDGCPAVSDLEQLVSHSYSSADLRWMNAYRDELRLKDSTGSLGQYVADQLFHSERGGS